jgi:hypothetical protein
MCFFYLYNRLQEGSQFLPPFRHKTFHASFLVPITITLAVFHRSSVVLLRIREIDHLFRALSAQIRGTGEIHESIVTATAVRIAIVFSAG